MAPRVYSKRFDRAVMLAALAHDAQRRKNTDIPYIIHPVQVALILERHGFDEDLVVAGILHDVLEDLDYDDNGRLTRIRRTFPDAPAPPHSPEEIESYPVRFERFMEAAFGGRVLTLVKGVTERKRVGGRPIPWVERKRTSLAWLAEAPRDVVALRAADALHNMRSLIGELDARGLEAMERFNAPPQEQGWYFAQVTSRVVQTLGPHALADELVEADSELRERLITGLSAAIDRLRSL